MAITKERRGEMSEALLWVMLMEKGITLRPNEARREAGNLSKKTGIPVEEVLEFMEELTTKAVKEAFVAQKK